MKHVPAPSSGGLILSYKCNAACLHCMYACSPQWEADCISRTDLDLMLSQLAPHIVAAPHGREHISLNHGLHFTGGEPFLFYERLCDAVKLSTQKKIPSLFVETTGFWCHNDQTTLDRLKKLHDLGLHGILISVNPFYREYVPFENTRRCIEKSFEVFGPDTAVYQLEYFHRFMGHENIDRMTIDKQIETDGIDRFFHNVEFFLTGRAPYALEGRLAPTFGRMFPRHDPKSLFHQACCPTFVRSWHNHFDNYGNYMPGFCGGISYGDVRRLDRLLEEGIDPEQQPVLSLLMAENTSGLYELAKSRGFKEKPEGYYSKCHLCIELRKFLAETGNYSELKPMAFYKNLTVDPLA